MVGTLRSLNYLDKLPVSIIERRLSNAFNENNGMEGVRAE